MQSDIIGDIYDAILDPSLWEGVLERTAQFVGGVGASLFSKDASSNTGAVAYSYGIDPHYSQLYFEKYVKLDPTTTGHILARNRGADRHRRSHSVRGVSRDALLPGMGAAAGPRRLRELRPRQIADRAPPCSASFATRTTVSSTRRRASACGSSARTIRRAVLIGRLIDLRRSEAATFADILDGLSAGLFLVDAGGRIVHANAAGRAILADGDFLYASRGRLMAHDGGGRANLASGGRRGRRAAIRRPASAASPCPRSRRIASTTSSTSCR